MARVAHDALLRGAELVKLRVAGVEWAEDAKTITLHIHLSNANKVGPSERVVISDFGDISAVAYLCEYFRLMGFQERRVSAGPLWPVTSPSGVVSRSKFTSKRAVLALARQLLTKRVSRPRTLLATRIARAGLRTSGGPTAAVRSS